MKQARSLQVGESQNKRTVEYREHHAVLDVGPCHGALDNSGDGRSANEKQHEVFVRSIRVRQ